MKLLNKAIAVWLTVWILCPGGTHHIVDLLLDHHHADSSHEDIGFVFTTGEHAATHGEFGHEEDEEHSIFDHFQDTGILRISSASIILPVCPVTFSSENYLVTWLEPPGFQALIDQIPPQKSILTRAPLREVSGVYLL